MPDELARKIVDFSMEKNAVEFKSSFESTMNERIASELRDKKMEISNSMFKEEYSKDTQMGIVKRKKKEADIEKNDIAAKGTIPTKG